MDVGLPGVVMLQRARVEDVDFARASFDHLAPSDCVFVSCDFSRASMDRRLKPLFAARPRNVFRECRFDGADLRGVNPGQSRFEGCSFIGARLDGWNAQLAEFVECTFAGRIEGVRFYGKPWGRGADDLDPPRTLNEFRGNDFRRAELTDVTFVMGVDVDAQMWPEGDGYVRLDRIHQRLTRGRAEILRWKDLKLRGAALEMVHALSLRYVRQNGIVARRVDPSAAQSPEAQRRVWETLARVV